MPEIVFKGKEYVYNHHLTVPYRPLLVDVAKGIGPADLGSNLIIHGDNLHALKSLLPRYAGQVDLVFIDPPYNTGNEGWCYSDGVNSPIMKEWLSTNPVDGEDMLRHDKWLCMMWPRLVLLRELLSERGSIWITLYDNEVHRARMLLDEIFGEVNFVAHFVWNARASEDTRDLTGVSRDVEHILCYSKGEGFRLAGIGIDENKFDNPDGDLRGAWRSADMTGLATQEQRPNLHYSIEDPATGTTYPSPPRGWRFSKNEMSRRIAEGRVLWPQSPEGRPRQKMFLSELKRSTKNVSTLIDFVRTGEGSREVSEIFGARVFDFPKPSALIEFIVTQAADSDSLILDSFAGSGTTAHAVLKANAKDGGRRRFILVEGEDYADKLTAERVRRAIKGYAWVGTQRETLLEEKINFTQFKKADQWLAKIEAIKVKDGFSEESAQMELGAWVAQRSAEVKEEPAPRAGATQQSAVPPRLPAGATNPVQTEAKKKRFNKLNVELKDGMLKVEGEKRISERVDGLGGEFTYCTLGEPLDIEKLLSGESLPAFDALGAWLFHTATGGTLLPVPKDAPPFYLGEAKDAHVWLVYQPELMFLKSPEAALTLSRAKSFADWGHARNGGKGDGKRHLVFAPAKYMSNKQLLEYGVDYAPLPFALYREG
jgi:adenine-specific DNA-methyltransferase